MECLRYCYIPLIRQEFQRAAIQWNLHRIRPSTNPNSPPGRPDTSYFLPSLLGDEISDQKQSVDDDKTDVAEELCRSDAPHDCSFSFLQIASIIMNELGLYQPNTPETANELYIDLLDALNKI